MVPLRFLFISIFFSALYHRRWVCVEVKGCGRGWGGLKRLRGIGEGALKGREEKRRRRGRINK
jgi:hypothetical protein